jgi:transposase
MTKPQISLEKHARICLLGEQGYSTREIGLKEGVGNSTVSRIIKKKKETGDLNNKPKSGQPRLLHKPDERRILRYINSEECITAVDIQKKLQVDYKMQISADTICRTLKKIGFESRVRKKKPYLKKEHRQK